eukprot:TCONS_00066491-protein
MAEIKKVGIFAACVIVSVILSASAGGVGWMEGVNGSDTLHEYGLFRLCYTNAVTTGNVNKYCGEYNRVSSRWRAAQALMLLAVFLSIVACFLALVHLLKDKINSKLISLFLVMTCISALLVLAIITDLKEEEFAGRSYSWAYGLSWAGAFTALFFGIFIFGQYP